MPLSMSLLLELYFRYLHVSNSPNGLNSLVDPGEFSSLSVYSLLALEKEVKIIVLVLK
jgi:hypothetical protein